MSALKRIYMTPIHFCARLFALLRSSLFGFALFVLLIIMVVIVGLAINGTFHNLYQTAILRVHHLLANTGFGLQDVTVEGRYHTDRETLRALVNVSPGQSVFTVDLAALQQKLETLTWVEKAAVSRVLPNLLHIELTERQPFGLWEQENNKGQNNKGTVTQLIDRHGTPITNKELHLYAHLPIFTGAESHIHAARLMENLAAYPILQNRMIKAQRVSNRRWTLYLDHGGVIYLPAENIPQALDLLMDMESKKGILSTRGQIIDLRVPNRVFLRDTPISHDKTDKTKGEKA
ncbi:MAG: FtsQ-type POTRA domain-containing protein [Alphaproteobacteria bacterium]|nr:FtsQ-type POTRA domain-containing protein [Alphaproteobacteria bacterium]